MCGCVRGADVHVGLVFLRFYPENAQRFDSKRVFNDHICVQECTAMSACSVPPPYSLLCPPIMLVHLRDRVRELQ